MQQFHIDVSGVRFLLAVFLIMPTVSYCQAVATTPAIDQVMTLKPDVAAGKDRYITCVACHGTEGWGAYSGAYPQIAGQHASVIIKQILDISAGRRDNPEMLQTARDLVAQGPQTLADVAAYVALLKMNPDPGVGDADDDELGEATKTYQQLCSGCHGANGEGNGEDAVPLLQGQNYAYLLRQLKRIQAGVRKNADPKMREMIRTLAEKELEFLATYISRLQPPESKLGPYDWVNPDFVKQ
jgi:cytochrome c553